MSSKASHRRPYEKWERLSVVAVVVVAVLAFTFNHAQSDSNKKSNTQSTSTTAATAAPSSTSSTSSTTSSTAAISESPAADDALFSPVAKQGTDFKGTSIDKNMWDLYSGEGNQGVGTRDPSTVTQNNELDITDHDMVGGGLAQNFGQTYGRYVIRARMDKGAGYGPAILLWPDSEKWPEDGELDIVELPNGDRTQAAMTSHYGKSNLQQGHSAFGDYSQWHTYAIDWLPNRVTFYIDGVEQYQITDPAAIPTTSHHLAIQNDVGACGSFIGCRNDSTPTDVTLHVSSVRVFSYTGQTD